MERVDLVLIPLLQLVLSQERRGNPFGGTTPPPSLASG